MNMCKCHEVAHINDDLRRTCVLDRRSELISASPLLFKCIPKTQKYFFDFHTMNLDGKYFQIVKDSESNIFMIISYLLFELLLYISYCACFHVFQSGSFLSFFHLVNNVPRKKLNCSGSCMKTNSKKYVVSPFWKKNPFKF